MGKKSDKDYEDHETRLSILETDSIKMTTTLRTVAVIGSIILTLSGLGFWKLITALTMLAQGTP